MTGQALLKTEVKEFPVSHGKVREIYDLGQNLLIVATDRISAYDVVMPNGIPDKGKILTQMSLFWFEFFAGKVKHHLVSADLGDFPKPFRSQPQVFAGRSMLVRKAEVLPIECVVRGYLAGSGWKDYQASGKICGIQLPAGLTECAKLEEPIFTPATKATDGHDENISFERMVEAVGIDVSEELRDRTLSLYNRGVAHAASKGIIIADTKFEWGRIGDEIILIDELLTPDSSRFWPGDQYQPGRNQPSFDKQFVREWLEATTWDKNSPPPDLPDDIIAKTRAKYVEAYERLTGETFTP